MRRPIYRGNRVTPAAAEELTRQLLTRTRSKRGTLDPFVASFERRVRRGELRPQLHLAEYLAARQDAGEPLAGLLHALWAIESYLRARRPAVALSLEELHQREQAVDGALDSAQVRHLAERSLPALADMRRLALEERHALDELITAADRRLFGEGAAA